MKILRSEEEIIANWKGDIEQPVVSICCIAYNHESYIKDALEGFLIQETDFPFEILIHDDASTDKTADIIREYEAKYPKLIKPIFQVENQYSKGKRIMATFLFPIVKGDFVALCEGDDYWISKDKLQEQLTRLSKSISNISFHSSKTFNPIYKKIEWNGYYSSLGQVLSIEEVIRGGGGFIPTASIMLKKKVLVEIIEFFQNYNGLAIGDYFIQVLASKEHGALYLPDLTSYYRRYQTDNWSSQFRDSQKLVDYYDKYYLNIKGFSKILDEGFYGVEFDRHLRDQLYKFLRSSSNDSLCKKYLYSKYGFLLSPYEKLLYVGLFSKPRLLNVLKNVKRFSLIK